MRSAEYEPDLSFNGSREGHADCSVLARRGRSRKTEIEAGDSRSDAQQTQEAAVQPVNTSNSDAGRIVSK